MVAHSYLVRTPGATLKALVLSLAKIQCRV